MSINPSLHDLIIQAERLIADGQPGAAKSLVQEAYKLDRMNPDVLVLVAQVSSEPDVQRNALTKALATNPNHRKARELFARMQMSGSTTTPGVLPPPTPSSARTVPAPIASTPKRGLPMIPLLIGGLILVIALVFGALALNAARTPPPTTVAQAPTLVPTIRLPATATIESINAVVPATAKAVIAVATTIAPTVTLAASLLPASPTFPNPAPVGNAIELTATALNQQIATTLAAATERAKPTQFSAQQATLVAQVGATQTMLAASSLITGTIYVSADGSAVVPDPHVVMVNTIFNGQLRYPILSPNGKYVTFRWPSPGSQKAIDLFVANVDGSGLKALTTDTPDLIFPRWSPDSTQVAIALAGITTGRSTMLVAGLEGALLRSVVEPQYLVMSYEPAFSPDSKRIALFVASKVDDPEVALAVSDIASAKTTRLTKNTFIPFQQDHPYWSPDGKWIAYRVSPGIGIHLISSDGATQRVLPLTDLKDFMNPMSFIKTFEWSPDSRQLAFIARTKNNDAFGVVIQSIADGKSTFYPKVGVANTMGVEGFGAWSPDGNYFSASTRNEAVFLRADGGEPRRVTLPTADDNAYSIGVWSPDSKFVVVSFAVNKKLRTVFVPVEGGNPLPFDVGGKIEAWLP